MAYPVLVIVNTRLLVMSHQDFLLVSNDVTTMHRKLTALPVCKIQLQRLLHNGKSQLLPGYVVLCKQGDFQAFLARTGKTFVQLAPKHHVNL